MAMNNPYTRRSLFPMPRRTAQEEYEAALRGEPAPSPYQTGRAGAALPVAPAPSPYTTGRAGAALPPSQATYQNNTQRSWGNAAGFGRNYQAPAPPAPVTQAIPPGYNPETGTFGPGVAFPREPLSGLPASLGVPAGGFGYQAGDQYYQPDLFRDAQAAALQGAILSGQYQAMDAFGNPIGDPRMTQAARQSYIQEFGVDPLDPGLRSLAGQRQDLDALQFATQVLGVLPTQRPNPSAGGLAGQQMAARNQITEARNAAQEQRNQWAAAQAAQMVPVEQPPLPNTGTGPYGTGLPLQGVFGGPTTRAGITPPPRPAEIRPPWISGPAFGMSADESAANTMRGNAAFGIHLDRSGLPGGGGPQAALPSTAETNRTDPLYEEQLNAMLGLLQQGPYASQLSRLEDVGGRGTPAYNRVLEILRRRRAAGLY